MTGHNSLTTGAIIQARWRKNNPEKARASVMEARHKAHFGGNREKAIKRECIVEN